MEIQKEKDGEVLCIRLAGRFDATWSRHVSSAISESIRDGAHHIELDMEEVSYLSSAGIGVLLAAYKELAAIQGSFAVPKYSPAVRQVIDLAGLASVLSGESLPRVTGQEDDEAFEQRETKAGIFDVYPLRQDAQMQLETIGSPISLRHGDFTQGDGAKHKFPAGTVGLGLGAFGSGFDDCRKRYGEFLALAGTAACLPSDGSNTPDYLVSEGQLVPEIHVLYGLLARGNFSKLCRFEPKGEDHRVPLTDLGRMALELGGSDQAVLVAVAETASLVGTAIQRPPIGGRAQGDEGEEETVFDFPRVRDWFSFTAEPAYVGSVSIVVGFLSRTFSPEIEPFLRVLTSPKHGDIFFGHFHAAAFPYRPLRKGRLSLQETVTTLFEGQNLSGVLHLLPDFREAVGSGESEFVRGACWIAGLEMKKDEFR